MSFLDWLERLIFGRSEHDNQRLDQELQDLLEGEETNG